VIYQTSNLAQMVNLACSHSVELICEMMRMLSRFLFGKNLNVDVLTCIKDRDNIE